MNPLRQLGIEKKERPNFIRNLFYFMREIKVNPLDENYEIEPIYEKVFWKFKRLKGVKVKKKGLSIPMFNSLLKELGHHNEREKREMQSIRRR